MRVESSCRATQFIAFDSEQQALWIRRARFVTSLSRTRIRQRIGAIPQEQFTSAARLPRRKSLRVCCHLANAPQFLIKNFLEKFRAASAELSKNILGNLNVLKVLKPDLYYQNHIMSFCRLLNSLCCSGDNISQRGDAGSFT